MESEQPIEELLILHPHLLQKFMRQGKDFANLLALYTFYTYQAKIQKTNQPLATDEFTRKGMNWAGDRVKKTKRLLKKMGVIEVVQKGYYSYIKLPFIYTKKRIGEILGNFMSQVTKKTSNHSKREASAPKKIETPKTRLKPSVPSLPPLLKQWLAYCDKNGIRYYKNSIKGWNEKLKDRLTIEQQVAIYTAINNKWKNFYIKPIKESKVHKLLGKSLMMEKDCDTLLDISYRDKKYIYQFKNIRVTTTQPPTELFKRYGYDRKEVKTAPIVVSVADKIFGMVKRF